MGVQEVVQAATRAADPAGRSRKRSRWGIFGTVSTMTDERLEQLKAANQRAEAIRAELDEATKARIKAVAMAREGGHTLGEIAATLGVTRARVAQLLDTPERRQARRREEKRRRRLADRQAREVAESNGEAA